MAFSHGKDSVFKLGTAGSPGVVTDISAYLTKLGMPRSVDTGDVSVFSNPAKKYIVGMADGSISLEGQYDPAIDTQLAALVGVQDVAFEYGPQGTAVGKPKYTGNVIMTSYEPDGDVGSPVSFKADFQITGAVTRTTY